MMEDAVHFLSKETVVQAIARSATKVCLLRLQTCSLATTLLWFLLDLANVVLKKSTLLYHHSATYIAICFYYSL